MAIQTDSLIDGYGQDAPPPESFSLDDDMPQVERDYLAALLVEEAMLKISVNLNSQLEIIERFRQCGQQGRRSYCPTCQSQFYSRFFCKARLCDICSRIYGGRIQKKIMSLVKPYFANRKKGWTLAMLTLSESTAKYRGRIPNQDETKRFNKSVGDFCRLFYGRFRGRISRTGKIVEDRKRFQGAGTIAVNEFGQENNNLHSHILIYGPWIPQAKLLNAWIKITGGDRGCFIEPIRNPKKAAHYVAKYVTKPPRFYDLRRAVEFLKATKGTRRIRTGGVFYNQIKMPKRKHDPDNCPFCITNLRYERVGCISHLLGVFNLYHVRKNPDLYDLDDLKEIVKLLPSGVIPVGLPSCPSMWQYEN